MADLLAGRYRLDGTLGSGSMGVVHRAFDTVLNREVALKELVPPAGLDASEAVDRFLTEARAAAGLQHPSIVTVHDVVQHGDRVLMAMELLEGPTLHDVLQQAGRLDATSVRQVMGQIVEALAEAHSQGVVHRDLKPENVFWLPNGRVVVCDFGLARIGAGRGTQIGTVMGTPGYMAPEQVRGEEAGPAADVFALGAIAYELLAGRPAFGDPVREDQATLLYRVVNEDAAPLEVPDDPGLAQLVAWCLVKDPAQRPQQATEVLEALGGQAQVPASLPPATASVPPAVPSHPPRRGWKVNPLVLAGGGLGAVLVVLVVVLVMVASGGGDDTVTVTTAQRFENATDTDAETEPTIEEEIGLIRPVSIRATAERDSVFLRCTDAFVPYHASNLIDGDEDTGWGAGADDGTGQSATIEFGESVQLRRIGLTPGYTKVGPRHDTGCTDVLAYPYNRFVTGVRYEFDDGTSVTQSFEDRAEMQFIDVEVETSTVTLTILGSRLPPGADDDTILSEIAFEGVT